MLIAPGGHKCALRLALITIIGLALLALALYVTLCVALPVFQCPQSAGPYSIGTLTYQWVDTRARDITNAYSLAFFNRHLLDKTGRYLTGQPASQYPDVIFNERQL